MTFGTHCISSDGKKEVCGRKVCENKYDRALFRDFPRVFKRDFGNLEVGGHWEEEGGPSTPSVNKFQ